MHILLLILGLWGVSAHAVTPTFDVNVFYYSDDLGYSNDSKSYSRTFYDFMAGFAVTKKKRFIIGWNYSSMSFSDNPGTEESLSITDMGPKLIYYLDKSRTWVTAFTYNLITKADYNPGSASTEMRGTSMRFEAGYTPMMWENVYMGAKIVYYKAAFKEEITNNTNLAQVTNSRAVIYPAFAMTFRWD